MSDLEDRIRQRETEDLQKALYQNGLAPEAIEIAKVVLNERGASIPEPMSEEEVESEQRKLIKKSNYKFLTVVITIVGWAIYAAEFHLFDPSNGEKLQHSIFTVGLFLAFEFGWIGFKK